MIILRIREEGMLFQIESSNLKISLTLNFERISISKDKIGIGSVQDYGHFTEERLKLLFYNLNT